MMHELSNPVEILSATDHPKGGRVYTFGGKKTSLEILRTEHGKWFWWPSLKMESGAWHLLEFALTEWEVRARYKPALDITPPLPKGNPRRCMFCKDDMSGLAAHCLACGGAMHLACSRESGDKCLTPGCSK